MTRPAYSHGEWTELVCGLALDALEPEDETEVLAHLAECQECQQLHADLIATAGELASLAEGIDPPDEILQVLRAEIASTPRPLLVPAPQNRRSDDRSPMVARPARVAHRRSGRRVLTASLALGLMVAGGTSYALTLHGRAPQTVVAAPSTTNAAVVAGFNAAMQDTASRIWNLSSTSASATVVVDSWNHGYLQASNLTALATDKQYVLWGKEADGSVKALAQFASSSSAIDLGPVNTDVVKTGTFIVSVEPAGTVGAKPKGPSILI